MPVANRDSSELTRARRALTLYSYANVLRTVQTSSNVVLREQPSLQASAVYAEARQGACYCANSANNGYIFGGRTVGGSCGCGTGT
jgi:hypothetical protein